MIAFALVPPHGTLDVEDFYEYNVYSHKQVKDHHERHKFGLHHCTETDLLMIKYGFPGAFFPLKESFRKDFEKISPYLMCLDNKNAIHLIGNEDEVNYENFFVEVDVRPKFCSKDEHYYCHPTIDFSEKTQDVGFYTVTNQIRFDPTIFDVYPFHDESVITYFENVNLPQKNVQRIQQRVLVDEINLVLSLPGKTSRNMKYFGM